VPFSGGFDLNNNGKNYVIGATEKMPTIGEGILIRRVVTQEDFNYTAQISGDYNPIHIDPKFCATTRFKKPVAHGIFLYGLIMGAIWKFLGNGVEFIESQLMFPTPTYAGEELIIWVTVSGVKKEERLINLDTFIIRPNGYLSCRGNCTVRLIQKTEEIHMEMPPNFEEYGFEIGKRVIMKKVFTLNDVKKRAALVDDKNPIYIDEKYVTNEGFKKPIVPGDMLMGMISNLLGTKLPGPGTNWLKQNLKFLKPAYIGEEITAIVEITQLRQEKGLINLKTYCMNPTGEVICDGEALVLYLEPFEKK
jgi:acyl dehydratase